MSQKFVVEKLEDKPVMLQFIISLTASSTVDTDSSQPLPVEVKASNDLFPGRMRASNVLEARDASLVSEMLRFLLTKYCRISIFGRPVIARSIKVLELEV